MATGRMRRVGATLSGVALVAATIVQIVNATAASAAGGSPSGTVWLPYPNTDSIEQGDGSLDLVNNFGSSARVTSSTAPLASAAAVSAVSTNFTVLLRTSDGSTGALPPNTSTQSLLSTPRVGVTPTSTVLEGGHANLTLDLTETKPYLPSTSIGSTAAQVTNGPFMYFVVNVTNTSTASSSPSAVYLGMDGACGAAMTNFPAAGSVALPLCSSADAGGTRYLVANTGAGVSAAVGSNLSSTFASSGSVSGSGTSGTAALSLQVPALAGGASWSTTLVYGGWNTSAGIKQLNGTVSGFYYDQWWSSAASMLSFAQQQAASAISASSTFDSNVNGVAADDASRYAADHAFRGWRHEQWLVGTTAAPQYYVTEGAFGYLSTLDVAYEYQPLQTKFEPWKSKLELDGLAGAYETDSAGNRYLQHDLGQWSALTAGPAYDLKSGTRKHMPVEHDLDFIAMATLWEAQTGQTYDKSMLQLLLNSVEARDTNSDGEFDVADLTACRPDGTCRTEPAGTTYDGSVTAAASTEEGNTILALKAGVVDSIAATKGYTGPGGSSLVTVAQRHLSAAQANITHQSSLSSLNGYSKHPGYLGDALLYAAALGGNSTLNPDMSWIGTALASNHSSVTSGCAICIAPLSTGDSTSWVSKALDGDVVTDWLAADYPSVSRPGLDLPKVSAIWVGRSTGLNTGAFESVQYPGETYLRADYYPRAASIWTVLWVGTGSTAAATIAGTITGTGGAALAGATVQACPKAGQACAGAAVSDSAGHYAIKLAPGTYWVWASAPGYNDTYNGGGHSSTDSADVSTTVTSGTTTVNLAMSSGTVIPSPVYIDAGSTSSYTDTSGIVWSADKFFSGGKTTTVSSRTISGTSDPSLYLSQRYGAFTYSIPEPAGTYQVTLKLAETWATAAGQRVFSVTAEGATVVSNLDIYSEVGANKVDDKTFTVNVSDGALSLGFVTGVQNPMVEGISVVSTSTTPPPSPGTVSGTVSSTGGGAISGATVSVCPSAGVSCGTTATTASNGSYSVSVAPGTYYVWATAAGFTDTYYGGGHSAGDSANQTVSVSSGATTTASISMPPVAVAPGTVSGTITSTGGSAISGATVSVCPSTGASCGTTATTAADGSYSVSVAPGTYYVWATASGYTDTYSGGGHSASDPADATISVTSGNTTTVSLAMPPASTPAFTPVYIDAGSSSSFTDSTGTVWSKDQMFSGGKTYTATSRTISGTSDSTLYLTQRYGAFTYSIPAPAGTYNVTLKLAETYATAAGQRVFSVTAEGATVVSNLDIYSEVGANAVDDKTFTVNVSDGALTLGFVTGVQNPMVEGIAVASASPPPPPPPSPGTVSGVISSTGGGGISGATVSVCPSAGVSCGVSATTASNGSYSVSVPAGSYYVWATASGYTDTYYGGGHSASDPADTKVTVASGNTSSVSLALPPAPATVSGVISSTGGGGISGATVSVCPSAGVSCGVSATTASNGSYSVSVAAGSYYVWATASGYTDTYYGGGHSASDPADTTISVAAGGAATVSLSMPPVSSPPPSTFTPIYIDAGSTSSYTDSTGVVWQKDQFFLGGKTYSAKSQAIAGTTDDPLYVTQRYGAFSYSIPVPNGTYQVTLKLAETWATAAGQRVFSVQAEGATVISNLDIYAEVGAYTVDDKTFTVTVSDGALSLSFVTGVQNPMVEGIAVQGVTT